MDIDDVLLAKIQPCGAASSIALNILSFKSIFSVAASTTNWALATPVAISVLVVILFKAVILASSVIVPLAICLSKFLPIVAIAFSD